MTARLVLLPFAVLEWSAVWLLRYVPSPIKNPPTRLLIQLAFGVGILGPWFVEATLYSSMTGIHILKNDDFFFGLTVAQHLVAVIILLRVAYERRRKGGT